LHNLARPEAPLSLLVFEAAGTTTPPLLRRVTASLRGGAAAVLGLAWSNVAQDVLDHCDLRGAAALGVSSAAALDDPATYPSFFRTGYSDLRAASVLVDNVAQTLGWNRIALVGTPDNAFGRSGIQGINASVGRKEGMEIVAFEPFAVGASDADLRAAVNRAAKNRPDGYIISAPGPDTRAVLRAAAATGHAPVVRGRGIAAPMWLATEKVEIDPKDTVAMLGAAAYICYAPPPPGLGRSAQSDAFVEAFQTRYGHAPDPWASYAYSEVVLVADGLRRARANRSSYPTLRAALRAADVWTPAGHMQYGAGSNSPTSTELGIYQFRKGDFFSIGEVVLRSSKRTSR
jgi:ABC-type branched-subunit amino acid transport system substrate-binding protein